MTKDEMLKVLTLLSTIDGYIIGSRGAHQLPDYLSDEFYAIVEMLVKYVKDE